MTSSASGAVAASQALSALTKDDRGRLLSALIARLKNFQLAEDALQDAIVSAVTHWGRNGVPASPGGWLLQVAFRKAIDRLRRQKTIAMASDDLAVLWGHGEEDAEEIPDERLRLIFTCCHPALEEKSQVALTLRVLGGLTTAEIASAFLDKEATMGQRLSRAKAKIAKAGIPFSIPDAPQWQERLNSVLSVIYLIFNVEYSTGPSASRGLAQEALFLCRLLNTLRPQEAEIEGCLALLILSHARRASRYDDDGVRIPLLEQDRGLWNLLEIGQGTALLEAALSRHQLGPYQLKAAIAACHCEGATSDWAQIVLLYEELMKFEPTAVVRLNYAVALSEAGHLERAMNMLGSVQGELAHYQPYHAARADLLARSGDVDEARKAYERAIADAASPADARFLTQRLAGL